MRLKIKFFLYIIVSFFCQSVHAQDTVFYNNSATNILIGRHVATFEDKTNRLTLQDVLSSKGFVKSDKDVPNLAISPSAFWVEMIIKNQTASNDLVINLEYPTIDSVDFFSVSPLGEILNVHTGEFVPYYKREFKHQNYVFKLSLAPNETRTYLLRLVASEQVQLPISVGTEQHISESIFTRDLLFGIYAGIMLVMFLYNLFLYFTVRDRAYLYYVGYIIFVGGTQACLEGYATRLFYPDSYYLANAMVVWVPALSGIFSIAFINNFLSVKSFTPILYKILVGFLGVYFIIIGISFTGNFRLSTVIMQLIVTILAIVVYITAVKISLKGYRPAKIFLVAWTIFIAAVVVFVLKNVGVLPYNTYTQYAMELGSVIEVVLLSFALADKINIFRKEKEESQAQTLLAVQENERIVREQNVMLEQKVTERTYELKLSNDDLNQAMTELKEAETQLVESEKMASLGQLTAGIAHEINNPINFVTSNVKPLNRDVQILLEAVDVMEKMVLEDGTAVEKQKRINDYKNEIDYDYLKVEIDELLSGIGDGASRTAEIVKGLRIFSRLDEDDLKKADINEGLDSTLVLTNNLLNNVIKIEKKYANLPLIECYPGKLNQVFLNIISNGIYAVRKKYGEAEGGLITITTSFDEQYVNIKIADNGTGMDENTKKKLFEPFFTTKDVGEGTGLGLSIVYNTINKHNGQIEVNSVLGQGSDFTIKLPLIQK